MSKLARSAAILPTGLLAKTFMAVGCASVQVQGLDNFLRLVRSPHKGLLSVSNHISVVDEPLTWGCLPLSSYLNPARFRWTLGANEILFTNPIFRAYFNAGQVFETFRGQGIYQKAVDDAIQKLRESQWVHIFPEGRINQDSTTGAILQERGKETLLRFRWGVARMLLEAEPGIEVVPIYIAGFEKVMSETRRFTFLPAFGANIRIVFGQPVTNRITPLIQKFHSLKLPLNKIGGKPPYTDEQAQLIAARKEIADTLREEVAKLAQQVETP